MMDIELHDHITRGEVDYPAYVYSTTSAGEALEFEPWTGSTPVFVGFSLAETLRAIVEPGNDWSVNDQVTWNGNSYLVSYVSIRRDIHGTDHHVTLTLQTTQ